ncbi:protein translocase subunit SecD [bacterium]|nr:protein translocase subunit SecD [bacterium]
MASGFFGASRLSRPGIRLLGGRPARRDVFFCLRDGRPHGARDGGPGRHDMNRSLQIRGAICLIVLLLSVYLLLPTFKAASFSEEEREAAKTDPELRAEIEAAEANAIRRGLDLQGGMYLVLEVDIEGMSPEQATDAMARVREILTNRVDQFGVSEPVIQTVGNSRIIVQLPGLQNPQRAKNLIGSTARLEFRLLVDQQTAMSAVERLDETFRTEIVEPGDEEIPGGDETGDAVADTSDAMAEADGDTASPFDTLPDLDELDAADTAARDEMLAEAPFSGRLIPTPYPYFMVLEDDVDAILEMLESPEGRVATRGVEFQLGMDTMPLEDGSLARALYPVSPSVALTGDRLTGARERPDQDIPGNWTVSFSLDRKGARQFAKVTGENVGEYLTISLDGRVKSAPTINSRIPGGEGVIQGQFTSAQASDLALLLRAGALPADVTIAEERTVGPSLGSDSIRQGIQAALWGSVLVALFMLVYYRGSGVITDIALVSNILILMAVLAQFGLVLTLPGIAGVILTVGMAVDANVLINERVREELRKAKTVRAAIQSGYQNATRTILDANITTLIVGLVLWNFGTGPVKGFAVTLCIGIVTSMFTALVMTRVIMEWLHRNKGQTKISI